MLFNRKICYIFLLEINMKNKFWIFVLILVLLGVTTYFYQVDVTPEDAVDSQVLNYGWPLHWIETNTTVVGANITVGYNIVWHNLIIDVAVYGVLLLLIFG
jgi:hypothetical protein